MVGARMPSIPSRHMNKRLDRAAVPPTLVGYNVSQKIPDVDARGLELPIGREIN